VSGIVIPLILFASGLIILLKGADTAVKGAEGLAVRAGVSATTIGLTVVAFGTSLPELVVCAEAFSRGAFAVGTGNAIGSNIANIGLILGIVALLMPSVCSYPSCRDRLFINTVLTFAATLVFILLTLRGILDRFSGIILLIVFCGILAIMRRTGSAADPPPEDPCRYPLGLTIAGLAAVVIGAHLLLTGALEIAELFSVPQAVIGLSMVAVGTSLPELATSAVAAMKKSPGIAVGNILGSNIFNLLFVLGANSLFFSIPTPDMQDVLVMAGFTLAIIPLFIRDNRVTRIWGGVLLAAYLGYIALLYGVV